MVQRRTKYPTHWDCIVFRLDTHQAVHGMRKRCQLVEKLRLMLVKEGKIAGNLHFLFWQRCTNETNTLDGSIQTVTENETHVPMINGSNPEPAKNKCWIYANGLCLFCRKYSFDALPGGAFTLNTDKDSELVKGTVLWTVRLDVAIAAIVYCLTKKHVFKGSDKKDKPTLFLCFSSRHRTRFLRSWKRCCTEGGRRAGSLWGRGEWTPWHAR